MTDMLPVRPAADRDAQDLFGLLSLCFAAYPGCFVDPHGDLPDLVHPGRSYPGEDCAFWVVEDETGRVCACVAVARPEPGTAELHRLYVRPDRRRRGLAEALVRRAESFAAARGAHRMVLWSDTRFTGAHRLYERLGYRPAGPDRALGDLSNSIEHAYARELGEAASGDEWSRASSSAASR